MRDQKNSTYGTQKMSLKVKVILEEFCYRME
jgi:hypothetical protein